ncbi:Occlusion-derived virus envelope protein e66 [Trabala vishnou gigantina nucleopolyhedrovirus]|uniref:Occlusion-derived virus envelope protein e66 n=1 Tax=Trabala vishnou gigantina nucleopolyhedrovirus TaxID=2863583 RepID=UPI002481A1E9|nr:Occlusion-derived virus envelope protein e66 [Trabala vishnou gigantina nucleopolyhedrovirus]QYC92660.1 Occlusion-derived virus envelope protein e66 [Trabala vishnou gigantina nucleopolyhedrovirus]
MLWTLAVIALVIVIFLILFSYLNINNGSGGGSFDSSLYTTNTINPTCDTNNYHTFTDVKPSSTSSTTTATSTVYDNVSLRQFYDLSLFESYYLKTLNEKFAQKAEKIANPTRRFTSDGNVFEGIQPWVSPVDFGTLNHTLIGYGVRFRNPADPLYLNAELAANLRAGVMAIYERLPYPPPLNSAPWGPRTDWYHFSITMPECLQNTCIVLKEYYDLSAVVEHVLAYYLPQPTWSLGWRRTAGNAMRMCLPYAYGQLLRGRSFEQIKSETEVQYVLNIVAFPLVPAGNGIHYDYAYFDHTDVRAYGYLINTYFTFSYYNFLFGPTTVNMDNLYYCIALVGSKVGYTNPAILSRQGSNYSQVLASFIDYVDEVVCADFSKILTIRTDKYFGSVVGQSRGIAYYEADENNNLHAPLWSMTRKIWANDGRVIRYRAGMLGIESGIILLNNLTGTVSVPTTGPSTSSFHPKFANTALCATTNAGAMAMHVRLEELNLEFYSFTLYHRFGMFHIYDKIKSLIPLTANSRCVVLTRDLTQDTGESKWTTAANVKSYNKVTAKHHNIINNPSLANFTLRNIDSINMQSLEQIISADAMNAGSGVSCFSLLVQDYHDFDNTNIIRVDTNVFVINTNSDSIQCVVDFPIILLKDEETREVTINDASSQSLDVHRIDFDKIIRALSYVSLNVASLKSSNITRTEHGFQYENIQSNQFKFTY